MPNQPADVRAFDPRPAASSGSPQPPRKFKPMRGKRSVQGAAASPDSPKADVAKGNPSRKNDGARHFTTPKAVNPSKAGTTISGGKGSNANPSDVRGKFSVKP